MSHEEQKLSSTFVVAHTCYRGIITLCAILSAQHDEKTSRPASDSSLTSQFSWKSVLTRLVDSFLAMNFGKYAVEESGDEETPQQEQRGGQHQTPAGSHQNPHQGDQQAQPRPTGARRRTNPQPTHPTGPMRTSFVQPAGLPAYWSTAYSPPASQIARGPQLALYSGFVPWPTSSLEPSFSGAAEGFLPGPSTHTQGPLLRSMARNRIVRQKWTERGRQLLTRIREDAVYSTKVFVGGLPTAMTVEAIGRAFHEVDVRRIYKKERDAHAYLVFASDTAVKNLLSKCEVTPDGAYFFPIGPRNAQVIPWALQDAEYGEEVGGLERDTIFVGGLHGETTAEHLKIIMEESFGQVRYVKIDTDEYNYPSGSARVQFLFHASLRRAIEVNFLEINTKHYARTVQLEPFFEKGRLCSRCKVNVSTELCKFTECLDYFCQLCFEAHEREQSRFSHLHVPVGYHRSARRTGRR